MNKLGWLLFAALCLACSDDNINLVSDPGTALARPDAAARPLRDAAESGDADAPPASVADAGSARCGNHVCACSDGLDNDGDGLVDGLDPECTGSYDDDEATFGIGKPNKQNQCRDCFWDDNAGSGDDGCRYAAECLSGTAKTGKGSCATCTPSAMCISSCGPRTPNGCDCFGCCAVQRGAETVYIALNDACALDKLDDTTACPRCVPSSACQNPCGRCELCLGKRLADLPSDCKNAQGAPAYSCDQGETVCATTADCSAGHYCQQGCCLVAPI